MTLKYRTKWLFVLILIITPAALLSQLHALRQATPFMYADYMIRIVLSISMSWFIIQFFQTSPRVTLSAVYRPFFGILFSALTTLFIAWGFTMIFPGNVLIRYVSYTFQLRSMAEHALSTLVLSVLCYLTFYTVYNKEKIQSVRLENEVLEREHLRAQLMFLEQQLNPHFLFNSLNILKTIAQDQATKSYVMQLAGIYRYILKFNAQPLATVQDELQFIRAYTGIISRRYNDMVVIDEDVPEPALHLSLPPLSLQAVLDHAIALCITGAQSPLHIKIYTENGSSLVVEGSCTTGSANFRANDEALKQLNDRYAHLSGALLRVEYSNTSSRVYLPLLAP